jgi:hypothetical protein
MQAWSGGNLGLTLVAAGQVDFESPADTTWLTAASMRHAGKPELVIGVLQMNNSMQSPLLWTGGTRNSMQTHLLLAAWPAPWPLPLLHLAPGPLPAKCLLHTLPAA